MVKLARSQNIHETFPPRWLAEFPLTRPNDPDNMNKVERMPVRTIVSTEEIADWRYKKGEFSKGIFLLLKIVLLDNLRNNWEQTYGFYERQVLYISLKRDSLKSGFIFVWLIY